MIRLENLTKIYHSAGQQTVAVNNINLHVPEGKICILLGPSGCGKTTTLKMVNRLVKPTRGTVYIDGQDTANYNTIELRRHIGYVIQQIGLFPNMTVEENIAVVPKLLGWPKAKIRTRVIELLEMMTLDSSYLKRYPKELSGGQQQRIGVARALAADPPVLLMDEPFGAIDPINRQSIQDEFIKMQQTLGKTVLFVSHDIDEAIKMGDRIALFRDGEIEQYDTPANILAHPASDFVRDFLGADRTLKRLSLVPARSVLDTRTAHLQLGMPMDRVREMLAQNSFETPVVLDKDQKVVGYINSQSLSATDATLQSCTPLGARAQMEDNLRTVLSRMLNHETDWLPCTDEHGVFQGYIHLQALTRHLDKEARQ